MKKFILNICLFAVVAGLFYIVFIGVFGELLEGKYDSNLLYEPTAGYNDLRLKEVENIKEIDVLFIGSSHSYRSFDPRILKKYGLKTFNLGSSSQTHIQTNYLLNRYLKQLKPKLVVYEVFPNVFSSDGVESSINLISSSPKLNFELLLMAMKSKNLLVTNNLIHTGLLNTRSLEPRSDINDKKEDLYVQNGFVQRILDTINTEENKLSSYWSPNRIQLEYFYENLELIKSNKRKLLLVQTPYTYEYSNRKEIENFFKKFENYENLNNKMDLSDSLDFYDPHHVNQIGAEKVTQYLAPLLVELLKKNEL